MFFGDCQSNLIFYIEDCKLNFKEQAQRDKVAKGHSLLFRAEARRAGVEESDKKDRFLRFVRP